MDNLIFHFLIICVCEQKEMNNKEEVIEDFNTEFSKKQSLKEMILTYSKFKVVDLRKQSKPVFTDDMKDNILHYSPYIYNYHLQKFHNSFHIVNISLYHPPRNIY